MAFIQNFTLKQHMLTHSGNNALGQIETDFINYFSY